jgi:hypothetical protein
MQVALLSALSGAEQANLNDIAQRVAARVLSTKVDKRNSDRWQQFFDRMVKKALAESAA